VDTTNRRHYKRSNDKTLTNSSQNSTPIDEFHFPGLIFVNCIQYTVGMWMRNFIRVKTYTLYCNYADLP
jgi:hypothetical protein